MDGENGEYISEENLKEGYFYQEENLYKFYTIQSAIDAAEAGATIKILQNRFIPGLADEAEIRFSIGPIEFSKYGANLTIPNGKEITIDLNGKKISGRGGCVIKNSGTLTIEDYSAEKVGEILQESSSQDIGIYNAGTVTVIGGTVRATTCGIYNSSGTTVIGNNDEEVEQFPEIFGSYAIYGNFALYDGILYGEVSTTPNVPLGYRLAGSQDEEGKKYYYLLKMLADEPIARINKNYANNSNLDEIYWKESDDKEYFEYYTIQSAINAATNGATIILLKDRTILESSGGLTISVGKEITIDLNGKTILGNGEDVIENSGNLIIVDSSEKKEGKILQTSSFGNGIYNALVSYGTYIFRGTVTVKGGTIIATGEEGYGIKNAGTVTIEEGAEVSATGEKGYGIYNYDGTVTVRGGTISATGEEGYGIYNEAAGNVTIGTLGDELSAESPEIKGTKYGIYNLSGILNFYDGVIKGSEAIYGRVADVEQDNDGNYYEIIIEETTDGMEELTLGKDNIASITVEGGEPVEYANIIELQKAIDEAEETTIEIKILRDIIIPEAITKAEQETDIVIPTGKNIILDLNGKTIKGSKKGIIGIEENATLEVVDNSGTETGEIRQTSKDESYGYKKAIINKGTFKLTSGKVESEEAVILNGGILNISGGMVKVSRTSNSLKIEYGIHNEEGGTITLGSNDGTVSTTTPVIEGITFGIYDLGGIINFYDGIIKGTKAIGSTGTINKAIGYEIDNSDSSTAVLKKKEGYKETSVALVGEEPFFDGLQEAINSDFDGVETTIYLLADIGVETPIEIPEGTTITLDLNGHTITNKTGDDIITNNGTLTILDSTGTITEIGTVKVTETGTFINQLNQGT